MRNSNLRALPAILVLTLAGCRPGIADGQGPGGKSAVGAASLEELARVAQTRRLSAGFLIVDGVYNTELTAPYDILQHTLYHAGEGLGIDAFTVSPDGETVTTAEGLKIQPHHSFATAPAIDILIVPSAEGSRDRDLERRELIDWVKTVGIDAGAIMSLCWGAFVLAEAGLLDDAACTTFPSDYQTFAARFPKLDLRINVSFVHSGKAVTSQGGARSFDAAMYLVDALYGTGVARGVGGGLLIAWPPADGEVAYLSSAAR